MNAALEQLAKKHALSPDQKRALQELDQDLSNWSRTSGELSIPVIEPKRPVTQEEINQLLELVGLSKLIVTMGGGNFGFSLHTSFLCHPSIQDVITSQKIHLPAILTLTAHHFVQKNEGYDPRRHMDAIWDTFKDAFYSDENRRVLAYYKKDAPRERSYYEY
ncbi:MAG: hypothetical protein U0487_02895 [Patescibacteria group bacterium]